ncbi:UNVERIFIED_CONTAM: Transposon Ty3-G Gag-Pol polyprotein [Sesamum radiatum]|uniref:Transposon Ty3-G Gag-Pol polyprotein n=1 Tax=Sesamum radiatum TaxID=300843 RepID=A0AAW2VMR2_SESRA
MDFKDKKPAWQRVNMVYTPLTVPITQALMAVEGKGLLSRPRTYRDGPRQPKSDKFCRFHNDYGHKTEECRHLKSKIERLIQNGYLQEYVCWERARGTGPYKKHEMDKGKEVNDPGPASPIKSMPWASAMGRAEVNDPPRKGIIRMITGGPNEGDSQRARKAQGMSPRSGGHFTIWLRWRGCPSKGHDFASVNLGDLPFLEDIPPQVPSAIKRGKKRILEETSGEKNPNTRGKDLTSEIEHKEVDPIAVQPMEELLTVELIPGDPDKITKDLEGIDPSIITHHLNLDHTIKPIKQKKRHFGPEKDKIIQGEVNKLLTARHIREIQFPEWLSNVVLVPKPGGKWRMCIDFRDLNKACPKDYYPLPRINQLVDSTSECELLSMMDAS